MTLTAVNICNLALAKIGDVAQITSLTDGSTQANYCSLFYQHALDLLVNEHPWGFATKTIALSPATGTYSISGSVMTITMPNHGLISGSFYNFGFSDSNYGDISQGGTNYIVTVTGINTFLVTAYGSTTSGTVQIVNPLWGYAYCLPADFMNPVSLHGPGFSDAYQIPNDTQFNIESGIIYTNQSSANLVYLSNLTEVTSLFSPMFIEALTVLLASMLAGPIIKGDQGVAAGEKLMQLYSVALAKAISKDIGGRKVSPQYTPRAIAARMLHGQVLANGSDYGSGDFAGGINNII